MSTRRMCAAAQLSRASYYRFMDRVTEDPDMELRNTIQKIALSQPSYGYRRVQAAPRRTGQHGNHNRGRGRLCAGICNPGLAGSVLRETPHPSALASCTTL